MDNLDFKSGNKNNKDIYFSNGVDSGNSNKSANTATAVKAKKKKKGSGVGSTYLFFLFVIAASMVISIYAIFCMNDIFAITKNTSTVTISLTQEVKNSDDAIDILSDNGLI